MCSSRCTRISALALATVGLLATASAAVNYKTLLFKSNLGSFKLQRGIDPAWGKLEFSFTGTVLVSGLVKGTVTPGPNVRLEYSDKKYRKLVYHGSGKIVIDGTFDAIQFFGVNVSGTFTGLGIFRPYGEFDRNLNTGEYWYEGDEHQDWGTGGPTVPVPGKPRVQFGSAPPPPKIKMQKA